MTTEPEIMPAMRRIPRDPETVLAELREHEQFRDVLRDAITDYIACLLPTRIVIASELQPTPLPDIPDDIRLTLIAEHERILELQYELKDAVERRNAERDEREERRRDGRS